MQEHHRAVVLDPKTKKKIADVGLNGYKKFSQGPIAHSKQARLTWSFKIINGDQDKLRTLWAQSRPMILQVDDGDNATVRLALMPATTDGYGLFEFV